MTSTWIIETTGIRKAVTFSGGKLLMTSLVNKASGRSMLQDGKTGEEFQIQLGTTTYTGATGTWLLESHSITDATSNSDGSVRLRIAVSQGPVRASATYVVYPQSQVIEQYTGYTNISASSLNATHAQLLNSNVLSRDMAESKVSFYRFTGAENTADSWQIHEERPTASWLRDMSSSRYAAADAIPQAVWLNRSEGDGVLFGWSYTGAWYSRFTGSGEVLVEANGMNGRTIAPGQTYTMPVTHMLAFAGSDLDAAGDALKEFQYRHKWDYTNTALTAAVKPYYYPSGSMQPGVLFNIARQAAHVGATVNHLDSGWSGQEWSENAGLGIAGTRAFGAKNSMATMVWLPIWDRHVDGAFHTQHPSHVEEGGQDCVFARTPGVTTGVGVDLGQRAAVDLLLAELRTKAQGWGPFIWRQDGGGLSFSGSGINEPAASINYFQMMVDFRQQNPGSGVNVNHCGGQQMSVESVRRSDLVQTTDGAPGARSITTPTYLYPPDKLWGATRRPTTEVPNPNPKWDATRDLLRAQLGTSWQWDAASTSPTYAQLEAFRENADIYRYLKARGLAGRWSRLYHPQAKGDTGDVGAWTKQAGCGYGSSAITPCPDSQFYLQRMSDDRTRGVIIPLHTGTPDASGTITVYPKNLVSERAYTVRFMNQGTSETRTGAELMRDGIATPTWGGNLVWLNEADYPGAVTGPSGPKTDQVVPTAPTSATKRSATYMSRTGVEITWPDATDDNWVSYYEVFRDGVSIGKRPISHQFFDPYGQVGQKYEVQTVDGGGNRSARTLAAQ